MKRRITILVSQLLLVVFIVLEGLVLEQLLTQEYPYSSNPIVRGVLYTKLAGQLLLQSAGLYGLAKRHNWGRWLAITSFMLLEAQMIYDELHPSDVLYDNRVTILVQMVLAFLIVGLAFTRKAS